MAVADLQRLFDELEERVDTGGGGVASISGAVSGTNTTTTPLLASATYTGQWVEVINYATVTASVLSDVSSATDGFAIEFSHDAVEVVSREVRSATGGVQGNVLNATVSGVRYARVSYVNGVIDQESFSLMTLLKPIATTDFPGRGVTTSDNAISVVLASDHVAIDMNQLHQDEDAVKVYGVTRTFFGQRITANGNTTQIAAPSAGFHLMLSWIGMFRFEKTITDTVDIGIRPGTAGADWWRIPLIIEGSLWQANLNMSELHLPTVTAIVVNNASGTLTTGEGVWVAVGYETRVDA